MSIQFQPKLLQVKTDKNEYKSNTLQNTFCINKISVLLVDKQVDKMWNIINLSLLKNWAKYCKLYKNIMNTDLFLNTMQL